MSGPPWGSPLFFALLLTPPDRRQSLDRDHLDRMQRDWEAEHAARCDDDERRTA